MSNYTNLAMQNRDAEAMKKKRQKAEIEDSLLGGGSSGSGSSNYSGGFGDDASFSGGNGSGALTMQDMMMYAAAGVVDIGVEFATEKLADKITEKVKDFFQKEGGEQVVEETVQKAVKEGAENLAEEAGEKTLGKATKELGERLLSRFGLSFADGGGITPLDAVSAGMAVYDIVDWGTFILTGGETSLDEVFGINDWVDDKISKVSEWAEDTWEDIQEANEEMDELEDKYHMKGNTVSIKEVLEDTEKEKKKKKEMEETEKARKLAEQRLKQEEQQEVEDEDDEEGEEEEEEEDEDESSGLNYATKQGLKKGLLHTLGTFGGSMAVSLSMIGIYRTHYTGEFEYKGVSGEYQSSNYTFQNFVDYDENGDVILKGLTKENKLMKTFYTKYSDKSYYAIVEDSRKYGSNMDDAYLKKNLLTPDELREQYPNIEDVNNREAMFQINPDVLYVLDKYIHEDKVLYPQQFVKPLYYEESQENFGLKDLLSEKGEILAKSQVFNADGSPAKDSNGKFKTTPGIWDYGFASILRYKEYEVPRRKITAPVKREIKEVSKDVVTSEGDILVEELVSGAIPGASNVTTNISNRPEPAYIIDTAVTPGGTVTNEVEQKWQRSSEPATPSTKSFKYSIRTGEKEICSASNPNDSGATPPQSDSNTSDIPGSKPEDIYSPFSTRESTVVNGETCTTVDTYTVYEVTDHYETYIEEELPQYVGEPSSEGISGSEYFRDYMASYSNYYPDGLPRSIDFKVLENEEIQSLIYDDDPAMFGMGGSVNNNASTITKEEFQKAVFMGDSITNGLKNYNAVPSDRVYAQDGNQVITGDRNFSDKILAAKPPIIIIGYGTNDAGNINNLDKFTKDYKNLIKKFQDGIPGVKIFLNKIFPGDESKASSSNKTLIKNIPEFNKALSQIASETNVTLIDCTGIPNLKSYYESDGIHFKSNFYSLWLAEMEKQIVGGQAVPNQSGGANTQNPRTSIVSKTSQEYSNYTQVQARTGTYTLPAPTPGESRTVAEVIQLGTEKDDGCVVKSMQYMPIFEKYGNMYGIDPYILIGMASNESCGDPNSGKGKVDRPGIEDGAKGIMQIEDVVKKVTAYNQQTGQIDVEEIPWNNDSIMCSPDWGIKYGAMQASEAMSRYAYKNILAGLTSYNLGPGGMQVVAHHYLTGGTSTETKAPNIDKESKAQAIAYLESNHSGWITATYPGDLPAERTDYAQYKDPNDGVHDARTWYRQYAQAGVAHYIEKIFRFYAGDGSPWIKDETGATFTLDGGAASGGSGMGQTSVMGMFNSYLNSNWSSIIDKWDILFPGQNELDKKLDLVKKGDYTQLAANYQAKERNGARSSAITIPRTVNKDMATMNKVDSQLALNMMFALNQSNYLFKYDNMTEAEWKAMYTQLLSSPTGQTWDDKWIGFSVEDIFGIKEIDDLGTLFPSDIGITPSISVPYGMIKNIVSGDENKLSQYNKMNFGIDIVVPPDTDVLTVADGIVMSISKKNDINSRYGNYVKIKHAKGTTTLTANLKTVKVKVGDEVKLGDVIGTSGGDCKSYKDNAIFYQIINNGNLINPTWVITREMTGFEDPIQGNNGVICGGSSGPGSSSGSVPYVETALQQVGKPYVFGGKGPDSFDCSSLVLWSMKQNGIEFKMEYKYDRVSANMRAALPRISYEELQRGDLIFRHGAYGNENADASNDGIVEHVMIYLGDGQVLHASSPERGILVEKFNRKKNHTFGRYEQALSGSTSSLGSSSSSTSSSSGCQTPGSISAGEYSWPVPVEGTKINSYFGEVRGSGPHKGMDIGTPYGHGDPRRYNIPIYASVSGVVEVTNEGCPTQGGGIGDSCGGGLGNYVRIKDSNGNHWIYGHMAKGSVAVKENQTVKAGEQLGIMGSSGSSSGTHLHIELREGGLHPREKYAKDPLKYLKEPY